MSVHAHLEELKKKHQSLSDQVEVAQRSPGVDDLEISAMKKAKLKLKEEIARLSAQPLIGFYAGPGRQNSAARDETRCDRQRKRRFSKT